MNAASSWPANGDVRVWHADAGVLADPARRDRAMRWLTDEERTRHGRFRLDADRDLFLLGRLMARRLVGDALAIAPTAWHWREGPHGRPEIDRPPTPLRFNLSHSGGVVACAIASGHDVGVDVEDLRRTVNRDLVVRCCSPEEVADVDAQGADWRDRFLTYWTLKEAYLKARGLGIAVHLPDISFSLGADAIRIGFLDSLAGTDADWRFRLERVTPHHMLAVAAGPGSVFHPSQPFSDGLA